MVFELRLKVIHDCPFLEFSKEFKNGISYGYCCRSYDVLSLPTEMKPKMLIELAESYGFPNTNSWRISTIKDQISFVQLPCLCDDMYEISITGEIQEKGGLVRYPISYEDGYEIYNIFAFDSSIMKDILDRINKINNLDNITIELLSNNNLGAKGLFQSQMISVPELFHNLTQHQISVMIRAFEEGYYKIPRSIRTKDIAIELDVSRYAVDKVIRTAENHIMRGLIPYLYFAQYLGEK